MSLRRIRSRATFPQAAFRLAFQEVSEPEEGRRSEAIGSLKSLKAGIRVMGADITSVEPRGPSLLGCVFPATRRVRSEGRTQ